MRSTRITVLGIVVFLFLQALSGCLRIDLRCKPEYDIDEDSVFFSKMPPRTENGANIVAFELDGKPYVFPKDGMIPSLFQAPIWICELKEYTKNDVLKKELYWKMNRRKKKYNNVSCRVWITLSEENLHQDFFKTCGRISLGSWFCEKEDVIFEITKLNYSERIICGQFSGVLKRNAENGTLISKRIENGFFDLTYTIVEVPDIVVQ